MLRDRDGWTWHRRRSWIAIEVGLTNGGNVLSAGGGAAKETIIIGCHGDGRRRRRRKGERTKWMERGGGLCS